MTGYPKGPIPPHGAYHILKGRHPLVTLHAYDDSMKFPLLGGTAIPDRTMPESVMIKKGGLKGLIAPWEMIDQKGATEDGVTNVDSLQGPTEVEIKVVCYGRTPRHLRKVVRELIASIDKKRTSELSFIDLGVGRWWADVRWFRGPPEVHKIGESHTQELTLVLRADSGFWRTYNDTASFAFTYDAMLDKFDADNRSTQDLGAIPQYYTGSGGGYCTSDGSRMYWRDDPDNLDFTASRQVINGPWPDFDTDTDNQVITQTHGSFQEFSLPHSARNIIGGRMGRDENGDWDGSGVFVEYGAGWVRLFYTIDFVEHTIRESHKAMLVAPFIGEPITLVCGFEGNPRQFKVMRGVIEVMTVKENGTGSPLGPNNRGVGNGMYAAGAVLTQATPASIRRLTAGDNTTVSQEGFLRRTNIGDQPMPDKYTLFGPGTFKFADGPGSTEMIEFGPLLPNQVVWIDTNRQKPRIKDLTSIDPSPADWNAFQKAWKDFLEFSSANNVPPLLAQIKSVFGIAPPQGNLYKLLKGRWSKKAAIPPKSPGKPAEPYFVKVSIDNGNSDSKIIASGTPLRRYPL